MYYLYIIYLLKKIEAGKTSKEDEQVNFHQDKYKVCFLFQCGVTLKAINCKDTSTH